MPSKPNIVLILADDMGYGDLSCLNGESRIRTPHMDAMAREGLVFADAHGSSAVCTPSRYSILTGRYAWRGRLQKHVLGPLDPPLVEEDRQTLPAMLRDHGYATACVGKWHLGFSWPFADGDGLPEGDWSGEVRRDATLRVLYDRAIRGGPVDRGFDSYFGVDVPNFPPYCFIENDRTVGVPDRLKPDDMFGCPGAMVEGWDLEAIMPTLTDKAVSYIESRADEVAPFFLYFPLTGPHTPIAPTAEYRGTSDAGIYGDWVTQMDGTVGAVNDALKRCGLAENTLVIVTSDNGSPGRSGSAEAPGSVVEMFGHNPSWILRGMKGDAWEGGHRVPCIASWPGTIEPGRRCDELVCLMDLMATAADLTGASIGEGMAEDSVSLLPYLLDRPVDKPVREELIHHSLTGVFAIRQGAYKFIDHAGSGGFSAFVPYPDQREQDPGIYGPPAQLYDMAADIRERDNLYFERQAEVARLARRLVDARWG